MAYSKALRDRAARMLLPFTACFTDVSRELKHSLSDALYLHTQNSKQAVSDSQAREADDRFDAHSKFTVVLETTSLNEGDLLAHCRSKGVYAEPIAQRRAQCAVAFNLKSVTAAERGSAKCIYLPGQELARKLTALSEAAALMILRKKAIAAGARLLKACDVLNLSMRTIQRWCRSDGSIREEARLSPKTKMPDAGRMRILETINQPEFANLPPGAVVPILADWNVFIVSDSTTCQFMREAK